MKDKKYQPYYDFEKPSTFSGENNKLAEFFELQNAEKEKAKKYLVEFLRTQEEKYFFKALNEHDFLIDALAYLCGRRESEDSESPSERPSVDFIEIIFYQVLCWKHEAIANHSGKAKQARRNLQKLGECMIRKKKRGRPSKLKVLLEAGELKSAVRQFYKELMRGLRGVFKQANRHKNLNFKNKYKKDRISEIANDLYTDSLLTKPDCNEILRDLDKLISKEPSEIAKHILSCSLRISKRSFEEFIK